MIRRMFIPFILIASIAQAQQIALVPQSTSRTNIAETSIALALNNVSVEQAVRAIGHEAGVKVGYAQPVSSMPQRVSLNAKAITVRDALTRVLKGTGLGYQIAPDGQIMVGLATAGVQGHRQNSVISGRVSDAKTGKGVSGANVSIDAQSQGVVSDENGSYRLAGISTGTHTVIVRLVGYAKQTRAVTVGEGATVVADFKLEPSANVLNDVIVTGTIIGTELKAVPNAITVITAKQIEERGITRIDQLFRGDIPGLFSLNLGSNALLDEVTMFSRGATALAPIDNTIVSAGTENGTNPIKTYVDGIEMADPKYLSQIDPSSIERIEILTGPQASTIYGANAINGVMQIFTKRGNGSRPRLTLSSSSGIAQNNFSSHLAPSYITDANVSGVEGRVSYNVGGSWDYVGSWTPAKQTQRLSSNGGGHIEWAKLTADVSARRGLTKNRQHGVIEQGSTELRTTGVYIPLPTVYVPQSFTQTLLGQTLGLSLSVRPISWWSHDLGFGSDASTNEPIKTFPNYASVSTADTTLSINPTTTSRVSEHYTTTMQFPLSSLARLNLTMGGDHWRTRGSSWRSPSLTLTGPSLRSPTATRTHPSKNSGAFVQGQLSIMDGLFFTYGVRADWNPNLGDEAKARPGRYGVSFAHDIGPVSAKLRGSYGRSIRPPSDGQKKALTTADLALLSVFGPFDFILANPDLGPEHQQGGEGGIELYLGSRASLVVTRYNQTVDNLISLVGSTFASGGPGLDSVRSLVPSNSTNCSSIFRDADGYCYKYQQQYLNVGSIRNQGWELTSSLNLGPFTTHGTYSWTKSRVLGITPRYRAIVTGATVNGSAFEAGRPFDFVPEHIWALGLTYAHSASSVSLSINGIGMRYIDRDALSLAASSDNRLSSNRLRLQSLSQIYRPLGTGYATTDLNATHRFASRIDATLQVSNLTNYYQNDFSAQYASVGRQSRIGARLRF